MTPRPNPVCPYCNSEIEPEAGNRCFCHVCGTAHHTECWEENGGCTVFGCTAAPPEEPKLKVSEGDFAAVPAPPPPPPPMGTAAPPPPPPPGLSLQAPVPPPALSLGGYNPPWVPPPVYAPMYASPPKSRAAFVVLGVFLGIFGVHNFYAGYIGRGAAQLCITLCTFFFGAIVSWIWAIVEVCTVDRDSRNIYMV